MPYLTVMTPAARETIATNAEAAKFSLRAIGTLGKAAREPDKAPSWVTMSPEHAAGIHKADDGRTLQVKGPVALWAIRDDYPDGGGVITILTPSDY